MQKTTQEGIDIVGLLANHREQSDQNMIIQEACQNKRLNLGERHVSLVWSWSVFPLVLVVYGGEVRPERCARELLALSTKSSIVNAKGGCNVECLFPLCKANLSDCNRESGDEGVRGDCS